MRRPAPLILSAILLGLLSALMLLAAVASIAAGFLMLHKGLPVPATPMPSPIPPSFLPILMFAVALFYVAVAIWFIWTLVDLVRLRSWARYSMLAIAGCMAFFGGTSMVVSLAMPLLMPSLPNQPPGVDTGLVHAIFLINGAVYGIFAAIGIALLVYYSRARVRALFLQNAPATLTPPNTSTGRPRPVAITVISWFFMISGPFTLLYAFLPFPAFILGFTISGFAGHLSFVCFAILNFAIGYGLFRLRPESRIAFLAWMIFGFFNMFAVLTPWGSGNFQTYMDKFVPHSSMTAAANPFASIGFILVCFAISAAINLFVLWLLHRHREAFTPAPLPPPMPILDASLAG